eukprot:7389277-Prymnesium_polylepis.1
MPELLGSTGPLGMSPIGLRSGSPDQASQAIGDAKRGVSMEVPPPLQEEASTEAAPPAGGSGSSLLCQLIGSPVWRCVVAGTCALFFVVTGIQFWVTSYLTEVIKAPKPSVVAAFSIESITAPLLGVFLGGTIVDRLGGYKGARGTTRTLKLCSIFALCAASAAVCATLVPAGNDASFPLVL